MAALTLHDLPVPITDGARAVLIPKRCPDDFVIDRKQLGDGKYNRVFAARPLRGPHIPLLFRETKKNVPRSDSREEDNAAEITYMLELSSLGIMPALYAYGFCVQYDPNVLAGHRSASRKSRRSRKSRKSRSTRMSRGKSSGPPKPRGRYWQIMDRYDGNLRQYACAYASDPDVRPSLCNTELAEVEHLLLPLFGTMAAHRLFCMDIHARNVVARGGARSPAYSPFRGSPLQLRLIDFDRTFCISSTRVTFTEHDAPVQSIGDAVLGVGADGGGNHIIISKNDIFVSLLIVFSSNTHAICGGVPFFRNTLLSMIAGTSPWLLPGSDAPDMNKVLAFLKTSKADGGDTLSTMRHWSHYVDNERASVEKLVEIVLGQSVSAALKFPVPRWDPHRKTTTTKHAY